MAQLPCLFVCVSYLTAVSSETTTTVAPGTAAPCASVTRPPIVARTSWALETLSTALISATTDRNADRAFFSIYKLLKRDFPLIAPFEASIHEETGTGLTGRGSEAGCRDPR